MSAVLGDRTTRPRSALAAGRPARAGLRNALGGSGQAFADITPNWFASVMGTGIVGVAAASLPVHVPGLRAFATVVWGLATVLLLAVTAATVTHWLQFPQRARAHHRDPVMAHFYGAAPMALLTVGAGTLLLGRDVLGLRTAVDVDWALWFAGTATGLCTAAVVPYLQFTARAALGRSGRDARAAFGGWLMPVVPPMVSASTGALLVPHAPAGQARLTLLLACYSMFCLSLVASLVVVTLIWQELASNGPPGARMVPTLWIVLGPLGQSVTAANLLAGVAPQVVPAPYAGALQAFGVLYGVPVFGFAILWAGIALAVTVRTVRTGLPFSLTWWSFTFPVGTCVTGASGLALHTHAEAYRYAAVLLYGALVLAWAGVGVRTLRGVVNGTLLRPVAVADVSRAMVPSCR